MKASDELLIVARYKAGTSVRKIARAHIIGTSRVYKILAKHEVRVKKDKPTPMPVERHKNTRIVNDFLIRPTEAEAKKGREAGLALITLKDLNPNFYQ